MLQGVKTQFFPAGPRKNQTWSSWKKLNFYPLEQKKIGSFLAGLSKIFSLLTIWPMFFWVNRVKKDVKNSQMEPFSRGIFTLRTWQNLFSNFWRIGNFLHKYWKIYCVEIYFAGILTRAESVLTILSYTEIKMHLEGFEIM